MSNYLSEHKFPEDLRSMDYDQLELLSYELRDFLVDSVSKTGGHLASNLGIVELTIALHRCFDTPQDKIIWDVGHQSYVHKILTGRMQDFGSLRKYGGISGFPKSCESEYDVFDTGHSSTSISLGLGLAAARDMKGEDYKVVSVIGDGAMTGGLAYEALNNAGSMNTDLIVVLNDNGMSISRNIGGLSAGVFSVVALFHDMCMVYGCFVICRFDISANFMAVMLTILGYSINATIIIYDRIRENERILGKKLTLDQLVNLSVTQTLGRSIHTTVTTVLAMATVCIVCVICGVSSIISFAFPLIIGMVAGVYSSNCIAPTLWVLWQKHVQKKNEKKGSSPSLLPPVLWLVQCPDTFSWPQDS